MKKTLLAIALASALSPMLAQAEAGDWVFRLRATSVSPSESSKLGSQTDTTYGAGTAKAVYGDAGAQLETDGNVIPEFDISYYFTKNIAAELILALGTRHDVNVSGSGGALSTHDLGSVNLLPPTLTVQWHFNPDQMFDPYVGAGLTYVRGLDNQLTAQVGAARLPIQVSRNAWGPAIQAGFDVNLENRWLVNFDVKKIWFDMDVTLDGAQASLPSGFRKIDSLDVDPWVVSVGFGKKF